MAKTQHPIGPVYKAYSRKGQTAVNFLLRRKQGEVPDAVFNRAVGWIDVVWGMPGTGASDGYGLSKIVKYHPEAVRHLDRIVKRLPAVSISENRIRLEDNQYIASVRRSWNGEGKVWLLTAFKKKTR